MLRFYKFTSYILIPIILIILYLRIIKNKEDKFRYKERLGKSNFKNKSSKRIIWLHAASIGEFKSSSIIIENYYKDFQILVTTTTKSSANFIKKYYNEKVIHQYIPFDVPFWCNRFLNYWKPSLILWIESDIWPNMLNIIKNKKINCVYINARISPNSFTKWKYFTNLYSISLSSFDKIYVQSANDLKRIKMLSDLKVEYIGNLKLSFKQQIKNYNDIKKKFTLMIVSTHKSEEEKIIKNIGDLIKKRKLKICIAPRHSDRIDEISKLLSKYNFSYSLASQENNLIGDVILIDSYGNLDLYFNQSQIVILGGSFVKKGGHNPIEPANYGCAIISGYHIYNWQNIYEDMLEQKACIIIKNIEDLKPTIDSFLSNKSLLENAKKKALDFSNKKFFDSETLFKEINFILD